MREVNIVNLDIIDFENGVIRAARNGLYPQNYTIGTASKEATTGLQIDIYLV